MAASRWNTSELKLAFHLYCQLPFGKLHQRNPEVVRLAREIGRTPSAVAMKLVNFASLDPVVRSSGRTGLEGSSKADREIWEAFHNDWDALAIECARLREQTQEDEKKPDGATAPEAEMPEDFTDEGRRAWTELRIRQRFFRRAVLASYGATCCMSGASEPQLLIASHIVPWSEDKANRVNPRNGLCLSAIHDRAFDCGLIAVEDDYTVIVAKSFLSKADSFLVKLFAPLAGRHIALPERFAPDREFLAWHRKHRFEQSV